MAVRFEMVNNSTADDAINVAQNLGGFEIVIGYGVQVIRQ